MKNKNVSSLRKKEQSPNTPKNDQTIHAGTYIENQEINHVDQVVYQDARIYTEIAPGEAKAAELQDARLNLMRLQFEPLPRQTVLPAGSRIPGFPVNPKFTGRNEELKEMAEILKGTMPKAVGRCIAVTGMAGIGKTQLVVEFMQRFGQFFSGGVFWIDFSQPDLIPSQVAECSSFAPDAPFEERLRSVLASWQDEFPKLLVFDNCENFELLQKWLPPTGGRRVLVTSQYKNLAQEMGVVQMPLEPLDRENSITLLQNYREDLRGNDLQLGEIAEELGDLPLALHLAGSYLQNYRFEVTPESYLADLRQVKPLQHRSMKAGKYSPTDHDLNVERTFLISYQKLSDNQEDQLALQILYRAACFAPGIWIPRVALQRSLDKNEVKEHFTDGLARLLSLGLVEENDAGDIWIHRLVSSFIRSKDKSENALLEVERTLLVVVNKINNMGYPHRMQPFLVHLQFLTEFALKSESELSAALASSLGFYYHEIAGYKEAQPYFEQALAIRRKVLGEEHPDTATSLNNLGGLFDSMGRYEEAQPYFEQALAIRRKVLGEEHPDTATSLNNLGGLFRSMGRYKEAQPYYEQALAILRKVLGEEHPDTATSLNNLGGLFDSMGRYEEAQPYYEQALAIQRKVLGEEHPDTATSLNNLGGLFDSMGRYEEAQPYFEQALAIRRKVLGEEHPDTATSLNNLGGLFRSMGRYKEAQPYYEQALAILRKVLGEEHPDTATSLNNLGGLFDSMGRYEEAQPYYEQALAIQRKVLGEEHPNTATSLNNLGGLFLSMGRYEEAQPYYEQALAIRRKVLGEEHPNTATSLNNLSFLFISMGHYEEALSYYEQALAIWRKVLGEEHPDKRLVSENLVVLLKKLKGSTSPNDENS